jgi:plastocyanin domain-containing protein
MTRHSCRIHLVMLLAVVAIVAGSAQVFAGGFWLKVGTAQATSAGGNAQRVLTVNTFGCHEPQNAVVSAKAVGLVRGRQESMELKLDQIAPGDYQIAKQWPADGAWVIAVTADYRGSVSSALIRLGTDGSIPSELANSADSSGPNSVQLVPRKLTAADLDSALKPVGGKGVQSALLTWRTVTGLAAFVGLAYGAIRTANQIRKRADGRQA